ncbi:hypothetical protein BDV10DRAFT_180732 [Aspergillus recurvatus]
MALTLSSSSAAAVAGSGHVEQHPCFVGEIVEVGMSVDCNPQLAVKDKDGNTLRISFAFPRDEERIPPGILKRGLTILILAAFVENVPGRGKGIEVLNPRLVKISPSPSPNCSHSARNYKNPPPYGGADYSASGAKHGHKSHIAAHIVEWFPFAVEYICQSIGGKEGRPNLDCKMLQDRNLRTMLLGHWECLECFRSSELDMGEEWSGDVGSGILIFTMYAQLVGYIYADNADFA